MAGQWAEDIDVSKALQLPGVKAVVTGNDVEGVKLGKRIVDTPVLAEKVVRFVGEKVAAVAAESPEIAEEVAHVAAGRARCTRMEIQ